MASTPAQRIRGKEREEIADLLRRRVDGEERGSVKRYREWLDHNELELALDELEALAEINAVQRAFWESMLSAADEMKLTDHAERYREKISD